MNIDLTKERFEKAILHLIINVLVYIILPPAHQLNHNGILKFKNKVDNM